MKKEISMYDRIEEHLLLKAIKDASLCIYSDTEGVSINEKNTLFGSTDYKVHMNKIEEAKKMLQHCIEKMNWRDAQQNINYYKEGVLFDTILFQGYVGGYKFYIGWRDGGQIKEHSTNIYTDLMRVAF